MSAFKAPPFLDGTLDKLQTSWQGSTMPTLNCGQIKATLTNLTVPTVLARISKSISPTYARFPRTRSHIYVISVALHRLVSQIAKCTAGGCFFFSRTIMFTAISIVCSFKSICTYTKFCLHWLLCPSGF